MARWSGVDGATPSVPRLAANGRATVSQPAVMATTASDNVNVNNQPAAAATAAMANFQETDDQIFAHLERYFGNETPPLVVGKQTGGRPVI